MQNIKVVFVNEPNKQKLNDGAVKFIESIYKKESEKNDAD